MFLKKTKMVSFRVSPKEFQDLQDACTAQGARNISELARSSMQGWMSGTAGAPHLQAQVGELRARVESLAGEVERIGLLVRGTEKSAAVGE